MFQDEVEIHRHPTLTRRWSPVGLQPEVPAPGQNEKQVVYGGVDYKTGKITHTIADRKSGTHFITFLIALVAAWLAAHRDQIEVYRLPPYCPSLNLIERLWGHLKRTFIANVLFETIDDLVAAFKKGVGQVNGRRAKMGFMFDHDDLIGIKAA